VMISIQTPDPNLSSARTSAPKITSQVQKCQAVPAGRIPYTRPPLASIEPSRERARAKPGWRYLELAVPHDVEVANPETVVALLAGIG